MVSFLSVSLSFSFCFFVLSDSVLPSLPLLVRVLPVNQTNALGSLSTTVYNIPRGLPSSSLDAAMCVCLRPLPLSSNASYVCAAALSLMPAVVRHHHHCIRTCAELYSVCSCNTLAYTRRIIYTTIPMSVNRRSYHRTHEHTNEPIEIK